MIAADGEQGPERRHLPVRYQPPAATRRGRRGRYQPRHALPRGADRTSMWLWLILLVTSGFVAGTTAVFSATLGESASSFSTTNLSNPTQPVGAALDGTRLDLSVAQVGSEPGGSSLVGTMWRYNWADTNLSKQGASPSCDSALSDYPAGVSNANVLGSATGASLPDVSQPASSAGRWMCVMAMTTYPETTPSGVNAKQWLSQIQNPVTSVQLGHVIQSVQLKNDPVAGAPNGQVGRIDIDDQIIVTFNQAVDATGRPTDGKLCVRPGASAEDFFIVATGATCADNPTAVLIAAFYNGTTSDGLPSTVVITNSGSANQELDLTFTWSVDAKTLTIDVDEAPSTSTTIAGGCLAGNADTIGCFIAQTDEVTNPASALESTGTVGFKATLCTAQPSPTPTNGVCFPRTTGRF